jgi:hypothetical protein
MLYPPLEEKNNNPVAVIDNPSLTPKHYSTALFIAE